MDYLIFVEGAQKGQRYPLDADRVTLGRERRNDIAVDDGGASRMHAQVLRDEKGLLLRDNDSTNGTYVNSKRVKEVRLHHGDRITIGDAVMLIEVEGADPVPQVVVTDEAHDVAKDVTVEMDSTILLSATVRAADFDKQAQQQFLKLFSFMTKVTGSLVMNRLLPLALEEMVRHLEADRGAILFLSHNDELKAQAIWPANSGDVRVSRTITEQVLKTKQGVLSSPSKGDKRLRDTVAISRRDVHSVVCVPLVVEDRVLGVVYLDTRQGSKPFSEQSLRLLSCMAMQLAITIQNAHLYRSLRNAEEFGSCILKSMTAGLLIVDGRDVVIRANDAACRILEFETKDLLGSTVTDDPRLREIALMVEQTRSSGIPVEKGEVNAHIDGRDVPLSVSASVLEDFSGKSRGVVVMFSDQTRVKRLAEQVRRSQRLASLGEMAAGIAHEVRNPLNSVHGFAQLLQEGADKRNDAEEREYAGIILEEVLRINQIVQDLLDFARQQDLTMSALNIAELMDDLVTLLEIEARQSGVEMRSAEGPRPVVIGNRNKLKQMFMNILRNAVQACDAGGHVEVTVSVGEDPGRVYPEAIVSVKDTGCGIDPAKIDHIFNPFFTTKDVGTGLGLSICQKIVEQHAGRIEVDSVPGEGSTFRIHLPMRETRD